MNWTSTLNGYTKINTNASKIYITESITIGFVEKDMHVNIAIEEEDWRIA